MNMYINITTGEVVEKNTKLGACLYFEKDAHKYGYEFSPKNVKRIVAKTGKIYGKK